MRQVFGSSCSQPAASLGSALPVLGLMTDSGSVTFWFRICPILVTMVPHGSRLAGCSGSTMRTSRLASCAAAGPARAAARAAETRETIPARFMSSSLGLVLRDGLAQFCLRACSSPARRRAGRSRPKPPGSIAGALDQCLEHVLLLRLQVGQRRAHRAGRAADELHARLDDRHRIALLAVADIGEGKEEAVEDL